MNSYIFSWYKAHISILEMTHKSQYEGHFKGGTVAGASYNIHHFLLTKIGHRKKCTFVKNISHFYYLFCLLFNQIGDIRDE